MFSKAEVITSSAFALIVVAAATAAPTIQANIPAFYQHQKAWDGVAAWTAPGGPSYGGGDWWESAVDSSSGNRVQVGWCGTTAWLGAIYNWSTRGYTNLFDHTSMDPDVGPPYHANRSWLERANYANGDLAWRTNPGNGGMAWTNNVRNYVTYHTGVNPEIQRYLNRGTRIDRLSDPEAPLDEKWNGSAWVPQAGVDSGYTNYYNLFKDMMDRGGTCVVRIGVSPNANNNGNWWTNFHVLTGAGYEQIGTDFYLYLADPNKTSGFVGAGADWGHQYAENSFGGGAPIGVPYYTRVKLNGNTISGGVFDGSRIDALYTMWVPTPGTATLVLAGLFATRRRRD